MKILLFNLGSFANRINAWGTEGFRSIFEQDVVLWGPITDEKFIYADKEIPIISFTRETSIKTVFERFPENWYPDIVTCDTSVLNFVPDIFLCPVRTILFTRDAFADTIYNRSLVEFFDFINYGIVDRSLYYKYQVNLLPLSNCSVSLPETDVILSEFEIREIDVICIANYDSGFYHERYKTLYNLSWANKHGINIRYVIGIGRKEINSYYRRSKIVVDWAHTLSNRSYEAALNGCLLFSHEGNPLIKEFWVPWEEYIPYNEDNVMELITFYLNNPGLAKKVINKAHEKVKTIPASFGEFYWEQIDIAYNSEVDIKKRINRIEILPKSDLHYRIATPFVYNYNYNTNFPANWQELYFNRIDAGINDSSEEATKIAPMIEAARVAFLLNRTELSERYLSKLELLLPEYAWIYYLRARIYYMKKDMDEALLAVIKAIDCGTKAPDLLQKFVLPVIEKNNSCDGRRMTDYLWQPVYGHNNEFQVKSLFHLSLELTGDIFHKKGEMVNAINSYSKAVSYLTIPRCMDKLCSLTFKSGDYKTVIELLDKGMHDSPYYSNLVFYSTYFLFQTGQKQKAFRLLKEHQQALKSFFGNRRLTFVKQSIRIILLLKFFGRRFISKVVIILLKILNRNMSD